MKSRKANEYWIEIARVLNTGKGYRNNTFPIVYFGTEANDRDAVVKVKYILLDIF